MVLQADGNLVIYDQRTANLCWARFGFAPGRIPKKKATLIISDISSRISTHANYDKNLDYLAPWKTGGG
ncbi:hypothetical protein EMIT0P43_50195 [Pseudomonas jessenii]